MLRAFAFIFVVFSFAITSNAKEIKDLANQKYFSAGVGKRDITGALAVQIGKTGQWGVGTGPNPPYILTFGPATFTSTSPDLVKAYDFCSNVVLDGGPTGSPTGVTCMKSYIFTPTAEGLVTGTNSYHIKWESHSDPSFVLEDDIVENVKFRGVNIPENSVNPPSPGLSKEECGSIVRVDGQSVGEHIPVVGTDFVLSYSSEFAQSYTTPFRDTLSGLNHFKPNGWNVSIQHYYGLNMHRLYKGSGSSEVKSNTGYLGAGAVVSTDGSEVYLFDISGKHLETKYYHTGARKYLFGYDGSNRLQTITDGRGNITTFAYTTGAITITAPFGQVTNIIIGTGGLISSISNPNSETYLFTYKTGTDLLETFTKPGGQVNTFTYSATGRLTKDEGPGGEFWSLLEELNPTERKVTMSSAMGRSSVYKSFLSSGLSQRKETTPFGKNREYHEQNYSSFSRQVEGGETVTSYMTADPISDSHYIPQQVQYMKGSIVSTTNSVRSVLPSNASLFSFTSITDTKTTTGRTHSTVYTAANKTRVSTSPMGVTRTSIFNDFEQPVSRQIGSDTPVTYSYDSFGRLAQVAQGTSNIINNTYNAAGLLETETNARSETTSYVYDLAGRVTQVVRPDTKVVGFAYDANGNVTGITPPGRLQHAFEFNVSGLMSKYDPPALSGLTVKETLYSYNLDKQLTSIVRPDTQSVQYTYGSTTGLLNQTTLARGNDVYTYYPNSNLVGIIDSADGIRSKYAYYGESLSGEEQRRSSDDFLYAVVHYLFDTDHRKTYRGIRGGSLNVFAYIDYLYNNDNQPTKIGNMNLSYSSTSGRLDGTTLDKITDSRTYDALGNLESYTATYNPTSGPAQVLYTYTLTRDSMSRIVGKTETIQGVTTTYVYTFDVVGRLTAVTKNGSAYSSYSYDDNGNRTGGSVGGASISASYDAQDRLTSYNARTYTYNANGDNTGIQWAPGSNSTFSYDALGKLLTAVTPAGASLAYTMDGKGNVVRIANGGVTVTRYIYDDESRIAGEFTDAGVMWRQFVYGTDQHSPDYLIDSTGPVRFIKDHLGSPRLIVKASNGVVLQRMDYDEFGRVTANTNPTYQPFGFAGGFYLRLPGLVKFGARYYDPEVARWTSKDPIRFEGGDTNLYGYVVNDPINWIDPTGLEGESSNDEFAPNRAQQAYDYMKSCGKSFAKKIKTIFTWNKKNREELGDAVEEFDKETNK